MVHSEIHGYRLIVLFIIANAKFCRSGATYCGRWDKHFRTNKCIHNIKPLITTITNKSRIILLAKGSSKYIHPNTTITNEPKFILLAIKGYLDIYTILDPQIQTITNKLRIILLANGLSKSSSGLRIGQW
jgi:hypothetical protein